MKIIIFVRQFNDFDNVLPLVDYLIRVRGQKDIEIYGAREDGYQRCNKHLSYISNILGKNVISFTNTCIGSRDRVLLKAAIRLKKINDPKNKLVKFIFNIITVNLVRFLYYFAGGSVKFFINDLPKDTIILADFGNEGQFPFKYLIKYSHKRSITILSYLHGYSIFSNVDSYSFKQPMLGIKFNKIAQKILFGKYSKEYYDKYLVGIQQRDTYLSSANHDGFSAQSSVVEIGIPRYTREWIDRFIKRYSEFDKTAKLGGSNVDKFHEYETNIGFNVTLFTSDSKFNVDEKELSNTIELLASCSNINLIIKMHTRGCTPELMRETNFKYSQYICEYDSSEIIEWADIGIVYGTSMSIQMLIEQLVVIVPSYIDSNTTILEENGVCVNAYSLEYLHNFLLHYPDVANLPDQNNINYFIKKFVYGDCNTYKELMDKFCYFLDE